MGPESDVHDSSGEGARGGLKLSFSIRSAGINHPQSIHPWGPQFHRWIPDGQCDAITLSGDDEQDRIQVWFERRTKRTGGLLRWDPDGKDFDPEIMRRQSVIDAGLLYGELLLDQISGEERACLLRNPKRVGDSFGTDEGDEGYVSLGKRITRLLYPPLSRFIATLRSQYGQYWLVPIEQWDSRKMTLATYCTSTLRLLWWNEQNPGWYWFLPTRSGQTIAVQRPPGRGYEEYLTEADWRRFQQARCGVDVSIEVQLIGNATAALNASDYRQAFVEIISALEIAVAKKFSSKNQVIQPVLQRFFDRETQSAQVAVVLLAMNFEEHEIEAALAAIKIRNEAVHEGYQPTLQQAALVRSVMQTVRKVSGIDEIKSPTLTGANELRGP